MGLYFWGNEKYKVGHKCPKKQIYTVKMWCENSEDDEMGEEMKNEEKEYEVVEEVHLSLHAISELVIPNYNTMRAQRRVLATKNFASY